MAGSPGPGKSAAKSCRNEPRYTAHPLFVSVVDPGVGTPRKSVVLKTKSGHYIVSPDNGSLAIVAESLGIEAVREIDESVNRIKGSEDFHTFHGRDVYSFTGARLASGTITYEEVGPLIRRIEHMMCLTCLFATVVVSLR